MNAQTLRLKLAAVPLGIKEHLGSEEVVEQIRKINGHFNIVGENRRVVPRLILRLEIHDLEPDYFAGELAKELNLDRDRALAISAEVKRLILGPIKKELAAEEIDISLLDEFNAPTVEKIRIKKNLDEPPPVVVEEIRKPAPKTEGGEKPKEEKKPPAGPEPLDISKIFGVQRPTPPEPKPPTTPPAKQTASISGSPTSEGIRTSTPPASAPYIASKPTTTPMAKPAVPLGEFERLGLAKKLGEDVGPAVLYKELEAKPGERAAGFKLEVPVPKFGGGPPAPPKSAILEFGADRPLDSARDKQPQPKTPDANQSKPPHAISAPRVVNYSELRTPLSQPLSIPSPERSPLKGAASSVDKKAEERDLREMAGTEKALSGLKPQAPPPSDKMAQTPIPHYSVKEAPRSEAGAENLLKKRVIASPVPPQEKQPAAATAPKPLLGDEKTMHPSLEPLMRKKDGGEKEANEQALPRPRIEPPPIRKSEPPPPPPKPLG